jgi:hypothetical protein
MSRTLLQMIMKPWKKRQHALKVHVVKGKLRQQISRLFFLFVVVERKRVYQTALQRHEAVFKKRDKDFKNLKAVVKTKDAKAKEQMNARSQSGQVEQKRNPSTDGWTEERFSRLYC